MCAKCSDLSNNLLYSSLPEKLFSWSTLPDSERWLEPCCGIRGRPACDNFDAEDAKYFDMDAKGFDWSSCSVFEPHKCGCNILRPEYYAPNISLQHLREVDLSGNNISGELSSIDHPNIRQLKLSSNNLHGPLPNVRVPQGKTMDMQILELASNNFAGDVPVSWVTDLPAIRRIDLSGPQGFNGSSVVQNAAELVQMAKDNQLVLQIDGKLHCMVAGRSSVLHDYVVCVFRSMVYDVVLLHHCMVCCSHL